MLRPLLNTSVRSCQLGLCPVQTRSVLTKAWQDASRQRSSLGLTSECYRKSFHHKSRHAGRVVQYRITWSTGSISMRSASQSTRENPVHHRASLHTQARLHDQNSGEPRWNGNSNYGNSQSRSASIRSLKWTIIAINISIFGTWTYANQQRDRKLLRWLHDNTLCSWYNVNQGRWWTMVTSAFTHQGFAHFLFNMFAIDAFMDIIAVSGLVSAPGLLGLVLGGALISSYAQLYNVRSQKAQIGSYAVEHSSALGASGVAMSLAALSTCIMPMAPMMLFFIPMPLFVLSGGYVAWDLYYRDSGSRIGHYAHLGGFGFGLAYFLLLTKKTPSSILGMLRRR